MGNRKKPVGAGLSLTSFAEAKISKYDKKAVLERRTIEKLRRHSKLKKLKRMAFRDNNSVPVDNVGALDEDLVSPEFRATQGVKGQGGCQGMGACVGLHLSNLHSAAGLRSPVPPLGPASRQSHKPSEVEGGHAPGPSTGGTVREEECAAAPQQHQAGRAEGRRPRQHEKVAQGGRKALSQLERLSSKVQGHKEENKRAREEASRIVAEKEAKIEAAKRARQQDKRKFLMRTSSGQPLLKFRIDKVLATLQADRLMGASS